MIWVIVLVRHLWGCGWRAPGDVRVSGYRIQGLGLEFQEFISERSLAPRTGVRGDSLGF